MTAKTFRRSTVFSALALSLNLTLAVGCKSAPPAEAPVAAAPAPEKPLPFPGMTDEQLVHAQTADGLGLGLRAKSTTFKVGETIPLQVLMEDFGAREPIASGMCSGFSLSFEDIATHDSQSGDLTNPRCFTTIPMPDEIPFTKGKIKTEEITQRRASNMQIPAGTYLMTVTWKASQAGKGTILDRPVYTTVVSNPVKIVITQ